MRNIPPSEEPSLIDDISYKLSSFIKTFTIILYIVLAAALGAVFMKFSAISGGDFLLVFSMMLLALLFLVQVGLSFFYIVSKLKLALLGAFSSLALAVGFLALVFRYQDWWGWQVMFFIAVPVFLITAVLIGMFLSGNSNLLPVHRKFLVRNLLIPYGLIIVLGISSFVVDENSFPGRENQETLPATEAPADSVGW